MLRANRDTSWWLGLAAAVLLISVGPTEGQTFLPGENSPPGCHFPVDLSQRQVMTAQLGFEDHQRAYLGKVQGASSQNILWIMPSNWPNQEPRRLFHLFKRER